MMKKISLILVLILVVQLLGCAAAPGANVETLKGWSFQYNEGTNDYSVFFALLDQKDRYIAAEVDVDIRIVNDREETVYREVHSVTKDDFSNYYSQAAGEQFLANVRIPAGNIKLGSASDGTVYLNIYIGDVLWFDEVNCEAWNCLPIKDVRVQAQGLPQEVEIKDYDGSKVQAAAERMQALGAQVIILGCTELPLAKEMYHLQFDTIDPTLVLAQAAVEFAEQ